MLILILAESALETVPKSLWKHPSVKRYAERRGKQPRFVLLDRSYHHSAMKSLKQCEKRGRPDIVHFALLEALGSPLNKEGLLQIYVHTLDNHVIYINSEVRLPKNYNRFVGLIEQLYETKRVPPSGKTLLRLEDKTLAELVNELSPDRIVAFSRRGVKLILEEAILKISVAEKPAVLIGGFPHGTFSDETLKLADEVFCIDPEMLEAWTVVSRVVYEYERAISIPRKRLKQIDKSGRT